MPILNFYPLALQRYNNSVPFTYNDGETLLVKVDRIAQHMNSVVAGVAALTDALAKDNAGITATRNAVDASISELDGRVAAAIADIQNSSIEVVDPVIKGVLLNPLSQTRVLLDSLYAPKA